MLKISFEPPKIGIVKSVKEVLKGQDQKKREQTKKIFTWTYKDRILIVGVLFLTILLSLFFWYKGQGVRLPSIKFGGFGFNETVILER